MKVVIVLFILFGLVIFYNKQHNDNLIRTKRHNTDEYPYAHFSYITSENMWYFPKFFLAKSKNYVLEAGQALIIPNGWWHWIKSEPNTVSITYWSNQRIEEESSIHNFDTDTVLLEKINMGIENLNSIKVWDSKNHTLVSDKSKHDNRCIITLGGYSSVTEKENKELHDLILPFIPQPNIPGRNITKGEYDKNIWASFANHDTGLHYDDYDGILWVLSGRKHVKLFNRSQTPYMYPISVIPYWVDTPFYLEYNIFNNFRLLNYAENFSSARLLYESLKIFDSKSGMLTITDIKDKYKNNIVWGFKKCLDGTYRWELYFYLWKPYKNLKRVNVNQLDTIKNITKYIPYLKNIVNRNLCIVSFNLYTNKLDDEIHTYYSQDFSKLQLPFFGVGETVNTNLKETHESYYVIDISKRFMVNYSSYLSQINIPADVHDKYNVLFNKYRCKHLCVFYKNKTSIFIMYIGILLDDFISFLEDEKYPELFIGHIKDNYSKYVNISHEITIVYDIYTLKSIRSSIYGAV